MLSQGAIDSLSAAELQAVLKHERAHARGRHDLVLLPFVALSRAFGWVPFARTARQAVAVLLEMIADDHARDPIPLARALVMMAQPAPAGGLGAADAGVVERVAPAARPGPPGGVVGVGAGLLLGAGRAERAGGRAGRAVAVVGLPPVGRPALVCARLDPEPEQGQRDDHLVPDHHDEEPVGAVYVAADRLRQDGRRRPTVRRRPRRQAGEIPRTPR